jgi:hypothetical protein
MFMFFSPTLDDLLVGRGEAAYYREKKQMSMCLFFVLRLTSESALQKRMEPGAQDNKTKVGGRAVVRGQRARPWMIIIRAQIVDGGEI